MKYLFVLLAIGLVGCKRPGPKPTPVFAIGDEVIIKSDSYRNCPIAGVVASQVHNYGQGWKITYALKVKKGQNEYCSNETIMFSEEDIGPTPKKDVIGYTTDKNGKKKPYTTRDWVDDVVENNNLGRPFMPNTCDGCIKAKAACFQLAADLDFRQDVSNDLCEDFSNSCNEGKQCQ